MTELEKPEGYLRDVYEYAEDKLLNGKGFVPSEPAWQWTANRFLDAVEYERIVKSRSDLQASLFANLELLYLTKAMGIFDKNAKSANQAYELLLTSYFLQLDLSPQKAKNLNLSVNPSAYTSSKEFRRLNEQKSSPYFVGRYTRFFYNDDYKFSAPYEKIVENVKNEFNANAYAKQFIKMDVDSKEEILESINKEFWGKKTKDQRILAYWTLTLIKESLWIMSGKPTKAEKTESLKEDQKIIHNQIAEVIINDRKKNKWSYFS